MHVTLIERHTPSTLDAIGGKLFLASHRLADTIRVDVSCWAPSVVASRDDLVGIVEKTLADLTVPGTVR